MLRPLFKLTFTSRISFSCRMSSSSPSDSYRAVRVPAAGPSSIMKIETMPPLAKPNKGEISVLVKYVGVNPVETYIRSGVYATVPPYPFTPGGCCSGIVTSIGEGVDKFAIGDRIYSARTISGSYAERSLIQASYAWHLPSNIGFDEGAALGVPYHTAYRAVFTKARVKSKQTILIHGASGAVGVACIQMAKSAGCRVIGTASSDSGIQVISPYCDVVITHGEVNHVLEVTNGVGVDSIIEMAAHTNLGVDLKMLAPGGIVVIVGSRGPVEVNPRDVMAREATVTGVMLWKATEEEFEEAAEYIADGLNAGKLKPIIGQVFDGLEKAAEAHDEVIEHKLGSKGKIIIKV